MDLARHTRALLRDCASELCEADRPPRSDEQHAEREHAQEVRLRDGVAADERREQVVERREEHQRRAEAEPAVQVVTPVVHAEPEADDGEQVQERLRRERSEQERRNLICVVGAKCRQSVAERAEDRPHEQQEDDRRHCRVAKRAPSGFRPSVGERRAGDQRPREELPDDVRPALRAVDSLTAEHRRHGERERRQGGDEEAAREQEVAAASFDGVADAGEKRDQSAGEADGRLQHEAELRERPVRGQALLRDEQRKRRPEEPEQQDLPPDPGLEIFPCVVPHTHSCRQIPGRR